MNPLIGAGLIAGGANLLGGLFGSAGAANLNRKTRRHQWDMMVAQQNYNDKVNQQQMDFQREVNSQNFAWNDESNRRQRIEAAGYNPYLYDNAATGSAEGAGLSPGSASLPSVSNLNPMENLGNAVSNTANSFLGAVQQQTAINSQNLRQRFDDYSYRRMVANDNVLLNGVPAYLAEGHRTLLQLDTARSQANISAADSFVKDMYVNRMTSAARDENGELVTDENGDFVNNFENTSNLEQRQLEKNIAKMCQDVQESQARVRNMDAETAIKRYDLRFIKPLERDQFIKSWELMRSQIRSNDANASAAMSSAFATYQSGLSTKALRPYQVGKASWDAKNSKYLTGLNEINLMNLESDFYSNDVYRRYSNHWLSKYLRYPFQTIGSWLGSGVGPALRMFK